MVKEADRIRFTRDVGGALKNELSTGSYSKIFILADENTIRDCLPVIQDAISQESVLITIKSGESQKTLTTCTQIWQTLTDNHADRHALLINLGGGVICDMGGFCARTYKRGIDFWNVPTTVLSQVDASVGGKLGIDFGPFKNHIGLFSEPEIVFLDSVFFKTLPKEEIVSGYAEMIKHTLIRDANGFKALINKHPLELEWDEWIPNSVAIKKEVVEQDPTEQNLRKILNFGHTVGHAVESFYLDTNEPLKHGEAVAIGMIAEAYLSSKKCALSNSEITQIEEYLLSIFEHRKIHSSAIDSIVGLAAHDKKNKDGKIRAVLINGIGNPSIDEEITELDIRDSLNHYNSLIK